MEMQRAMDSNSQVLTRQRGMSLTEVLVALTISLILILGVGQIYIGSRQTYRIQDAQSRLQENARYALDVLTRSIREAGFLGCSSAVAVTNTLNTPTAYFYNLAVGIQGAEWTAGAATTTTATNWTPTLDASITSPMAGKDVITIRGATAGAVNVTATMASNTADVTVAANNIAQCELVMVSDCTRASFFQVTSATASTSLAHATGTCATPGNAATDLGKAYDFSALITPVATTSYYLGTGASGEPSLWRRLGANAAEELVEGIEDMQILYGVDSLPATADFIPDQYLTANNVTDWSRVVSVRLNLLARTAEDNLAATQQTYSFNGAAVTAPDLRLRRVFTTTIGLRNRLR
jgi:type IV pilus assembly protein PilW